jgi:hypothetical protein
MADETTKTAPAAAVVAPPATWFIDADSLKCIVQQETNLTHGDEVYVASLKFRTRPGVAGSTTVTFHGGLVDIDDVNTGETHAIPNAMGRVAFANVTRLGLAELAAGQAPEVIGTATVVMESDLTRDAKVDKLFTEAAAEVRPILAAVSEQVSIEDLIGDSEALAELLAQLIHDINEALELTVGQKVLLFFGSAGDPDDIVGRRINIFVAVDDVLAPLLDAAVSGALPASAGVGGGLRTRTYKQRFTGQGASYDVNFSVSK